MRIKQFTLACMTALSLTLTACASSDNAASTAARDTKDVVSEVTEEVVESQNSKKGKKVTIRMDDFNASGANEQVLRDMIAEFNKVYPDITIDLQIVAYNGYTQQLMAKISAGTAPDIFELSFADFTSMAAKDVLKPLDSVIESVGCDMSLYNQEVLESFKFNGVQYGIPSNFSNVVMFYNKDLFDQAGASYPTADWTWNDVIEAGKKIRALGEQYYGYFRPLTYNEFYKVIVQNGGSIMNEDGTKFTVNTPEAVGAAEHMVDMVNKYNIQPTEEQMAGIGGWDLFKSGRLGMLVTGIWGIPEFATDCDFAWDIEIEPGNVQKGTHYFSNAFVINKDSEVAEEALLFLHFLTTDPASNNICIDANWVLPAVSDQATINRYTQITPPDNKKAVFESLDYLVTAPVLEQASEATDIVNAALEAISTGSMTAQDALDSCQKELDEKIDL